MLRLAPMTDFSTSDRNLLLVSSSRYDGGDMFAHCSAEITAHFANASKILFIPYARPNGLSHEAYTAGVAAAMHQQTGIQVVGIEAYPDAQAAVAEAEGIFIGGGNTFVLTRALYTNGLMEPIRKRIAEGMPYMGSSAGSNMAGISISTSNDMPIVYPPSFDALGAIPFNINPHYPRPQSEDNRHMGESRDQRIYEFHHFNAQPVVALREDGMLKIQGNSIELIGQLPMRLFRQGEAPKEMMPGADLGFLLG